MSGSLQIRPDRVIMWGSGSQLASWDIHDCHVERVTASRFSVQAQGETLTFNADDPAGLELAISRVRNGYGRTSKPDDATLARDADSRQQQPLAPRPSNLRESEADSLQQKPVAPRPSEIYKRPNNPPRKTLDQGNAATISPPIDKTTRTAESIFAPSDHAISPPIGQESSAETASFPDRIRLVEPDSTVEASVTDRVRLIDPDPSLPTPVASQARLIEHGAFVETPSISDHAQLVEQRRLASIASVLKNRAEVAPEPADAPAPDGEPESVLDIAAPTIAAGSIATDSIVGRSVEPVSVVEAVASIVEPVAEPGIAVAAPPEEATAKQKTSRIPSRQRLRPSQPVSLEPELPETEATDEPLVTEQATELEPIEVEAKNEESPSSAKPPYGWRTRLKGFGTSGKKTDEAAEPSTIEPAVFYEGSEPLVQPQEPLDTIAEAAVLRAKITRLKAKRFQPSDIKDMSIKVGAVVLAIVIVGAFSFSIYWLMGGSSYEPPPSIEVTTSVVRLSTTTTPPVETTLPPQPTTLFETDTGELTRRWNTLAEATNEDLILFTGISSPMLLNLTPFMTLEGILDPTVGRMTLRSTPTGLPEGDGATLIALGILIAMADPTLEPDDRRLLLETLGLDISDPQLGGIDAGLNYNGLNYRLIYFADQNVLDFTITPVSATTTTTTTAP